ncbi:MAG: hypothetical protein IJI14_00235 [Anaerolineaceae bacterium]|nr:hypothetical protein [Anaerolineaceae bacterium]
MLVYKNIFVYRRNFSPEVDTKGDYNLSVEQITLKPGIYNITVEGSFSQNGSGFYLIDSAEKKILSADFPAGGAEISEQFELTATKQLRFGVSYDPNSEKLNVNRFQINANRVFYKESFLRHGFLSFLTLILFAVLFLRFIHPETYRRLFPHLSKSKNEQMLIFLIFLTLCTSFPFFTGNSYVEGDDLYYHLTTLRGIAASLKAGHFPVRIILEALNNYGYGSGFYYPNLFLTFPAMLILLGFEAMEAYEIFVGLCSFSALLTMFLTIRKISQSERAACAGTILYAFAAYRLIDIYYRAALGEIQAFVFLPLIIYGLWEIFTTHPERWWIFALAFTGLLGCHMISLSIAGIFAAIWALLHARIIFSDKKIFFALLKSVLLTVLLGAYFLLPMLEQNAANDLKIKSIMLDPLHSSFGQYTPWKSLFRFFYDWNYKETVEHIYPSWWNYGISVRYVYPGWSLLLIPLLRLLTLRSPQNRVMRIADELSIFGFLAMIICTDIFPWQFFLPLLFRIQFAWRIMMISTVLLCVSCGIYTAQLADKFLPGKPRLLQLAPVFLLSICVGLPILIETQMHRMTDMDEYRRVERSSFLHGAEYLPNGFDRNAAEKNGDNVICDVPGFMMHSGSRKGLTFTFDYSLPENTPEALMHVPFTYYAGYHAYLTDSDGTTQQIPVFRDEHGLTALTIAGVTEGTVSVRFDKTAFQKAGDMISLASLLFCLFCIIKARIAHHKGIISA